MKISKESNNLSVNSISSVLLQLAVIIQGLLLPRVNLSTFGSDVNGLTSSINQFLGFFSVLEGGISGVILASLYRPIVEKDDEKLSEIVCAANKFLRKLAIGFLVYSLVVSVFYPFTNDIFSWWYTSSLVIIYSFSTFLQYYFSIVPQLIIRADNKVYIYNFIDLFFIVINILATLLCIQILPEIHFVKLITALAYIIEPLLLNEYLKKHYCINKKCKADENILKNRWNGFGINIANVITTNTDMMVLTFFATLKDVSIYSIYYGIVNAIKGFIMSLGYGFQSLIGQSLAKDDRKQLDYYLNQYLFTIYNLSGIIFSCCICLIVPFVILYTHGVNDANYKQYFFSLLICLAIYILCIREPYIQVTYCAGHFKETQKYAYIEAILNIIISVLCVQLWGLVGVAIGTVISSFYRYVATLYYLKKHILKWPVIRSIKKLVKFLIPLVVSCLIGGKLIFMDLSLLQLFLYGILLLVICFFAFLLFDYIFFREELFNSGTFRRIKKLIS